MHETEGTKKKGVGMGVAGGPAPQQPLEQASKQSVAPQPQLQGICPQPESSLIGPDGKIKLRTTAFKPYQGDLFGAFDNSGGMLYLSRIHYGTSPAKKFVMAPTMRNRKSDLPSEIDKRREAAPVWRNPHAIDRKRRFAVSLSTLAAKPDKRKAIVKEGAIAVLLKLACMRDRQTMSSCSQAFYNLALEPELRKDMIRSGAVPTIISLLMSPVRKIKLDCAQTLCNLAACPGMEGHLVQEGLVPALMSLSTVTIQLMHLAIMALLNLSCVDKSYPKIEEVADAALQYTTFSLTAEMELMLLKCLCNLTGLQGSQTQTRMIEEGLVQQIHSISKTTTHEGKVLCSKVISNLATCQRSRAKMVDHKVVFTLLEFLKTGSADIEQQCALTVTRLAADQTCREKLIQHGAVKAIMEMSLRPSMTVETCRACAAALRTFVMDREIARRVVDGGGIRALVNFMYNVEDPLTRQDCVRSLCWLFYYDDIVPRLLEEDTVAAVIDAANPKDLISSTYCASAFYALSWHPLCSDTVMDATVIACLTSLCGSESLETRKRCVATLWSLTQKEGRSENPAVSIPYLLQLLKTETDTDISRLCAAALCNLARDTRNCQRMLDEGAVEPIMQLCLMDNIQTKIQCGAILCRLASEPRNRASLTSEAYLRVLLQLIKVEDRFTQQRAVIAMVHMSEEPRARRILLDQAAATCLVQLSNKPDELIRRGCAAALCNLSYEVGSEKSIVKAGGVACLLIIALVATDNADTKTTCVKGVFNLLYDRSTHASMIADGIVWGFATLSKTDKPEVCRTCATALCNLSIDFPSMLLSTSCTRALFDMILHPTSTAQIPGAHPQSPGPLTPPHPRSSLRQHCEDDDETQRLAINALANLLSKTCFDMDRNSSRVKCSAVPVLKASALSSRIEVAALSCRCLTYISLTPPGRHAILEAAALHVLGPDLVTSSHRAAQDYALLLANLANHRDSRDRAIDAGVLQGLRLLADTPEVCDDAVRTCALRAMYSLSCSREHLMALVEARVVDCASRLLQHMDNIPLELRMAAAGLVYNLTTHEDALPPLAIQQVIEFLRDFVWPNGNPELRELCSLAACHLACGHVNSARMVQEGITPMLIHLAAPEDDESDFGLRCASAFRNLLLVNANHERMVKDGVIQAIVRLFYSDDTVTKQHCAAALRNITYNQKFRRLLVESGAISVIIEDSKMEDEEDDEDLSLTINLLFEMEAESWTNGSRGRHPEGRAPPLPPNPLFVKLLDKFDCRAFVSPTEISAELYKIPASMAQTAEPPLDLSSDYTSRSFYNQGTTGAVRGRGDYDVDFKTHQMVGGKVEVPLHAMHVLSEAGSAAMSLAVGGSAGSTANLESGKSAPRKREAVSADNSLADSSATHGANLNISINASQSVAAFTESGVALPSPVGPLSPTFLRDHDNLDRMFGALGQAVTEFAKQNRANKAAEASLRPSSPPNQGFDKPGTAGSQGTGGRRTASSNSTESVDSQGNPRPKTLMRSSSGTRGSLRDAQIDGLITSFKRSKTIEALLQEHRRSSMVDKDRTSNPRRPKSPTREGTEAALALAGMSPPAAL